tara:strand:- start:5382 stop:5579 length:198 start_codon:yes stop_codon:yes gene_type:complete
VLVDVREYERMQGRLELLEELYKAEEQVASGEGISNEDAKSRVLSRLLADFPESGRIVPEVDASH